MQANNTPADILVIDDTLANLQVLVSMLDEQGYYVRPVNSGLLGLRAARLAKPDLVLLDIRMAEMDGFEVCRRLKFDEVTRDIPVIFVSALNNIGDKVKAFQAGGVDYITKPFQLEEVLARVETHLEIQRLRRLDQQRIVEQAQLISDLDAYSHTVAHDLKNPLTAVGGYAIMLEDPRLDLSPQKRSHFVQRIIEVTDRMNNIIDALLLLADVRKRDQVIIEKVDMAKIVAGALTRLEPMIQENNVDIIFPETWLDASGFAPWIEEIWANYISNGIKYGGRPCCIELGADKMDDGMIRFWVQDNGAGMTPEEQAQLFAPFRRLSRTIDIQGHGLGLSIVQRIALKLGGSVGVEGELGLGSRFCFTLPA